MTTSADMTALPSMTIVVAATLRNGIGQAGGLPWRLPKEMKYFARVTTGEPLASPSPSSSKPLNTVIMGRKTWDGIPPKYRPLPNRRNLIVTRSKEGVDLSGAPNTSAHTSVTDALRSIPNPSSDPDNPTSSKIFLIGGSQLYTQALEPATTSPASSDPHVDRILLTRILTPFPDCDAFVHLLPSEESPRGWTRAEHVKLVEWVGWDVPEGMVEEKGVEYRFEMWVR